MPSCPATTPLERILLAAYLRANRAFARCRAGTLSEAAWNHRLMARYVDRIAASEDLRDHVMAEGEVESRKHLVKLGPDAEVRVVKYATDRSHRRRLTHAA